MDNVILITEQEGVVTLTINRPKALNAINRAVMQGLNQWFAQGYKSHTGLRGVIITGTGEKLSVEAVNWLWPVTCG